MIVLLLREIIKISMASKTKQSVLKILYNNLDNNSKNKYVSGNDIAKKLDVSRNAIWKNVKLLQEEGYNIESINNKGYKLITNTDILCKEGVEYYLNNNFFDVEYFSSISSTSAMLKTFAEKNYISNVLEGKVFLASHQTNGKGRRGREFFSPDGTGVYFSILLKPSIAPRDTNLITILSSIAVCESIEEVLINNTKSNIKPQIKWVNDIFINNRKVGGILTEASLTLENQDVNYIILGIGLNVYKPSKEIGFPEDIKNIAGYMFEDYKEAEVNDFRNKLVYKILTKFYSYYKDLDLYLDNSSRVVLNKYKGLSCILDKEIVIKRGVNADICRQGKVMDISEDFSLMVEFEGGEIKKLVCGEVSLKIK